MAEELTAPTQPGAPVLSAKAPPRPLHEPPEIPSGWVAAPPDFVGVGVQKAGTTWWASLIGRHPGVQARAQRSKELHFFDGFWERPLRQADIDAYHQWFARPPGMLAGEWTPRYLHDPWVAPLLRRAAPATHVLVLLRDPVERFRSGMAHELRSRGRRDPTVATDAFHRGFYHRQLTDLLRWFDRPQVLVLQYEQCVADPRTQLERTLRFLGLDPAELPAGLDPSAVVHRTEGHKPRLSPDLLDDLARRYRPDSAALAADFPEIDTSLWRSLAP